MADGPLRWKERDTGPSLDLAGGHSEDTTAVKHRSQGGTIDCAGEHAGCGARGHSRGC